MTQFEIKLNTEFPVVGTNYEKVKKELQEVLEKYSGIVFDDTQISTAKTKRAEINKIKAGIENARKDYKRECLKVYDEVVEPQCKELLRLCDVPMEDIDSQIKLVEQRKKDEKQKAIEDIYNRLSRPSFVKLEFLFKKEWLNAGTSLKVIEEDLEYWMKKISIDCQSIKGEPEEYYVPMMKAYEESGYDLSKAMQEKTRLQETKLKLEAAKEEEKPEKVQEIEPIESTKKRVTVVMEFKQITREDFTAILALAKSREISYSIVK